MPSVTLAGARLNYQFDGPDAAPVLVLAHGLGADLSMWAPQVLPLSERFRLLRYDARGHGQSSVPAGPYSIRDLGLDVLNLADVLNVGRFHFCGLSMGGMIGMWLAVNAPQRLDRLVLANTAAKVGSAEMWNARIQKVRAEGMAAVASIMAERAFTEAFRLRKPDTLARTQQMLLDAPAEGFAGGCAAIRDMDQRSDIARITAPTLVIAGVHDGATPAEEGRSIAETIPGARYAELDASHLSNVERPHEFNRAVLEFLQ